MTAPSETPLTDKQAGGAVVVGAEFARSLETAPSESRAECEELRLKLEGAERWNSIYLGELASLRELLDKQKHLTAQGVPRAQQNDTTRSPAPAAPTPDALADRLEDRKGLYRQGRSIPFTHVSLDEIIAALRQSGAGSKDAVIVPAQLWSSIKSVLAHRFPVCRDCADHDGICPYSKLPCDLDAALKERTK